ncbi:hypothetical protein LRH25_29645 [Ideonella azotifigens]|uniref:Uncharacterized protein n=1 Tax=Ideonella azotifigens TaxID=513160 RepID=A0ABN1KDQ2_9BURK|nr:hypothetical protein [Ideonella azotifigens]MCD2344494.1 hypothetical protein [Ideonella azotifigens]
MHAISSLRLKLLNRCCLALTLAGAAPLVPAAGVAPDSRTPIYLHRAGLGNVEGLKNGILVSVEACRLEKNLPPTPAPARLPSDDYLAKLRVTETEEYFDGARHATYTTVRRVAADPASGSCALALFAERHAWAGDVCGEATLGGSTPLGEMIDYTAPQASQPELSTQGAGRTACAGKKVDAYDLAGLPAEDAGGARCVWQSDVLAKTMKTAGLAAKGHDGKSPEADYCLYERQPLYVHNGHHELVVLKGSGSTEGDVLDQMLGEASAFLNERLLTITDGTPIPAERFSAAAVRSFVSQPGKTSLAKP